MFVVEFQNAFSDNLLKFLVTFIILGLGLASAQRNSLVPLVGAVFALPFVLFSMAGGFFADRFSKRNVTIAIKSAEIGIMTFVLLGLWLNQLPLLLVAIFLMSTHSAFFGPTKYGMLPELLPEKKLSWGNGVFGLGTFAATITGQMFAGTLWDAFGRRQIWSGIILVGLASLGLSLSLGLTRLPAADPAKKFRANFLGDFLTQFQAVRRDRVLFLGVAGNTFLWFLGALLQFVILFYGRDTLQLDATHCSYLTAALLLGIGAGSLAAGFLSGGKIEYGLVPLGMAGLTLFAALLSLVKPALGTVAANLGLLGFFGGLYSVPVSAIIQHRPDADKKGGIIALAALLSWIGILLASGIYYLLAEVCRLTPPQIFLFGAGLSLAGTVYCVRLMPDSLLRFLLWCVTHSIYRIRVVGRDHIPEKGGALFVCNHVSYVDALLLIASTDRPIRFLMFKDIYEKRWVKPFAKILGTIPVSSEQRPRELIHALQAASDAIKNGEVVCIFAEGQITRIGQLLPFRRGLERIMKDVDAPIVPVALDGVLGGPMSFKRGRLVHLLTARCPHPVTVSFGAPLPATATPFAVRAAVQELQVNAWQLRREQMQPLHRNLIRMAREHPHRFAFADATTPRISFGTALVKTIFLARRLKKVWHNQRLVGIYLPPSVPGALVNYAAFLCNKVPVNLNYTLSETTLADCVKQCEIKTIITSRKFLEKIKLTPPGEILYLEDLAGGTPSIARREHSEASCRAMLGAPTVLEKLAALVMAKLFPARLLEWVLFPTQNPKPKTHNSLDDLATIIFSSGSTGEPKGVMLSQFNLLANIEQCAEVIALDQTQRVLGILPFFHSFGFTVTLCLPLVLGTGVVFYPNPLDAKGVGTLVREQQVTVMLATATFLQLYLRGVAPEDFGSLKLIVTGAEKLPERLAAAFEERFGIRPFEGYGCTECAPAVAVNSWDYRAAGFYQVGGKHGKIGQPVPGMCVRIADAENPWSGKVLPPGESGMLLVRGPNVMLGYLNQPAKTADVLRDGWYCTGDMALLDEDGFLQITGRLNRFSKIGGEMVPHLKIEDKLQELAGVAEVAFVVLGLPDEKKGERLVVLHKIPADALPALLEKFAACDLPNLWKPKADAFYRVESFPMLGTGKLDIRTVKEMAAKLAA